MSLSVDDYIANGPPAPPSLTDDMNGPTLVPSSAPSPSSSSAPLMWAALAGALSSALVVYFFMQLGSGSNIDDCEENNEATPLSTGLQVTEPLTKESMKNVAIKTLYGPKLIDQQANEFQEINPLNRGAINAAFRNPQLLTKRDTRKVQVPATAPSLSSSVPTTSSTLMLESSNSESSNSKSITEPIAELESTTVPTSEV